MQINITEHLENALQWEWRDGGLYLSRFMEEQEPAYRLNAMYRNGYRASTGIRLRFLTDGDTICVQGNVGQEKFGVAGFFTQKVTHYQLSRRAKMRIPPKTLNRKSADCLSEESFELVLDQISQEQKLLDKETLVFRFENRGHEKKEVILYLPQHAQAVLRSVEVNGTVWPAQQRQGCMLAFGDSITSGSLGQQVSSSYVMTLAEKLGMNVINQGVPGYTFQPDSLTGLEHCPVKPNLITVAYGTNDWGFCSTKTEVDRNIAAYFRRLDEIFTDVQKVVITPIWRADEEDESHYGSFQGIRETICREAEGMHNVILVPGERLLPKEIRYLRDGYVHPGDEGQKMYGENLWNMISPQLERRGL